jgi:hypothetical protein
MLSQSSVGWLIKYWSKTNVNLWGNNMSDHGAMVHTIVDIKINSQE